MSDLKIIVKSRVWIPSNLTQPGAELEIRKDYLKTLEKYLFDEAACSRCPNRQFRPRSVCLNCKGYKGKKILYGEREMQFEENPNVTRYFCLPLGCLDDIQKNPEKVFVRL